MEFPRFASGPTPTSNSKAGKMLDKFLATYVSVDVEEGGSGKLVVPEQVVQSLRLVQTTLEVEQEGTASKTSRRKSRGGNSE